MPSCIAWAGAEGSGLARQKEIGRLGVKNEMVCFSFLWWSCNVTVCIHHLNNLKKVVKFVSLDLLKIRLDKNFSVQSPEWYFYDRTWQVKLNTCLNSVEMVEVSRNFYVVFDRKKLFRPCSQLKHIWRGLCTAAQKKGW